MWRVELNGVPGEEGFPDQGGAGHLLQDVVDVLIDDHGFRISRRGTPEEPGIDLTGPSGIVLAYRLVYAPPDA